jgi:hypothetical protein
LQQVYCFDHPPYGPDNFTKFLLKPIFCEDNNVPHFKKQGKCLDGAAVLEKDTYVDDIITSTDSMQESIVIAQDIETILATGSMGVKAFTFSKVEPDEKVSADGVHVGLLAIFGALQMIW